MLCRLLPSSSMNQPQVHMCPLLSVLFFFRGWGWDLICQFRSALKAAFLLLPCTAFSVTFGSRGLSDSALNSTCPGLSRRPAPGICPLEWLLLLRWGDRGRGDQGLSVPSAWGLSHSLPGAHECAGLQDERADCPVWATSQHRKAAFAGALEWARSLLCGLGLEGIPINLLLQQFQLQVSFVSQSAKRKAKNNDFHHCDSGRI